MKMNSQSRSFVRQVQVDLLALSDVTLFHTVHQWVNGRNASGFLLDIPEETRSALGYTCVPAETKTPPHLLYDLSETGSDGSAHWLAPSPHHLRTLLTAMDVRLFDRHVITLAFQSLHRTYPQWHEGMTFNAHLANSLRQMKRQSTTKKEEKHETP